MFAESLGKLLEIIKTKENFRIQIITREDIKLFLEFLDHYKLEYNVNCWNNISEDNLKIQIYTSVKYLTFDAEQIFLYSTERDLNFVKFVFMPSYNDKLQYLKMKSKFDKRILDSYKSSAIHELIYKIDKKGMVLEEYAGENFDYHEILLLYAVAKCSNLIEIINHVTNYDQKANNSFILRAKLNGLVSKELVLLRNNFYKLNISIETLAIICKKIDLTIYA